MERRPLLAPWVHRVATHWEQLEVMLLWAISISDKIWVILTEKSCMRKQILSGLSVNQMSIELIFSHKGIT